VARDRLSALQACNLRYHHAARLVPGISGYRSDIFASTILLHEAANVLPPTICPALSRREKQLSSQCYTSLAASVSEIPRYGCLEVSSMLHYVLSKGMARKHAVWSQELPSTSSRLTLAREYRQYGAIPQSATTPGSRCQVYTSSSTSKVREDWTVLLPWHRDIRPPPNVLLSIITTSSLPIIVSTIG
jgi:hypothetical protein